MSRAFTPRGTVEDAMQQSWLREWEPTGADRCIVDLRDRVLRHELGQLRLGARILISCASLVERRERASRTKEPVDPFHVKRPGLSPHAAPLAVQPDHQAETRTLVDRGSDACSRTSGAPSPTRGSHGSGSTRFGVVAIVPATPDQSTPSRDSDTLEGPNVANVLAPFAFVRWLHGASTHTIRFT